MEELNNTPEVETAAEVSANGKFQKTWNYIEKTKKHTINHTIILTKDRYTHQTEINTASHAMKSRTDLRLKDVHSVDTFYGLSRNIGLAVLLFVVALLGLIGGIIAESFAIGLVAALIFGGLGAWVLLRVKPAFMLQFNTIVLGHLESNGVTHGNVSAAMGAKARAGGIFGLIGNLFRSIFGMFRPKYKFKMPPEVGYDIVDTIGPCLFEE